MVVHFDGSWDRPGRSDFYGTGFTVRGRGFDHRGTIGPVGLHLINKVMRLLGALGATNRDGSIPQMSIRNNIVADVQAAEDALAWLRDQGYRGPVEMRGDGRGSIGVMSSSEPPNPGVVDAEMLTARWHSMREVAKGFSVVSWKCIPRGDNTEADELARAALEAVYAHSHDLATAAEKHTDHHLLLRGGARLLAEALPNRFDRRPIRFEDCRCGRCRRSSGSREEAPAAGVTQEISSKEST